MSQVVGIWLARTLRPTLAAEGTGLAGDYSTLPTMGLGSHGTPSRYRLTCGCHHRFC